MIENQLSGHHLYKKHYQLCTVAAAAAGQHACWDGTIVSMKQTGPVVASSLSPLAQRSVTKSYP